MKDNALVNLSKQFAVDIVNLCTEVKEHRKNNVLLNQLLRSGTSIGANAHEARYAQSNADFINKLEIALKECYETEYLLEVLFRIHAINDGTYKSTSNQCGTIRRKLIASITTAKAKKAEQ